MTQQDTTTTPIDHVTFTATNDVDDPPAPVSAAETLPDWYRFLPSTVDGLDNQHKNTSVKMCMPFGDALKTGWLLRSPITFTITSNTSTNPESGPTERVKVDVADPTSTNQKHIVDELVVTQRELNGNSSFRLPNIVLNTSWSIRTPPAYETLITPLLNRSEHRFTPHSLLVESGEKTQTDSPIQLPIHIHNEETPITIKRGDPIATIFPVNREKLISPTVETYNETTRFGKLKQAMTRLNDSRTGAYREEMWTPKPGTKTVTNRSNLPDTSGTQNSPHNQDTATGNPDAEEFAEENRPFLPDSTSYVFYCHEKYDTAIPDPKPTHEHIPDGYLDAIHNVLSDTQPYSPETIIDQISRAMQLGHIIELDRDMRIARSNDNSVNLIAESIAKSNSHQHDPRKAGENHPFAPLEVLNIFSEWSVVLEHGYSNLYIQPLNHFQQYQRSFSGIVDADWHPGEVNIPGRFTKKSNDVVLERGTPITQAIPIHRNSLLEYAVINRDPNQ